MHRSASDWATPARYWSLKVWDGWVGLRGVRASPPRVVSLFHWLQLLCLPQCGKKSWEALYWEMLYPIFRYFRKWSYTVKVKLSSLGGPHPCSNVELAMSEKVETAGQLLWGSFSASLGFRDSHQKPVSWTLWEARRGQDAFLAIFNDVCHCYFGAGELSLKNLMANWA